MDEILNLIESVSEGFPSYFFKKKLSNIDKCKSKNEASVSETLALLNLSSEG